MTANDGWALAAVALCVVAAAYLGAAQTALSRMTTSRADKLVEEGRRGAVKVRDLLADPPRTLNILALLVLSVEITGVVLLMMVLVRYLAGGWAAAIAAVVGSGALFVAAEVAPKTLAVQRTDDVARLTAPWVLRLVRPLSPLASVLIRIGNVIAPGKGLPRGPFVTEEDLREMIDVAESDEVIEETERAMIHSIFELGDTVVREIMVPRPDMVTVTVDDGFDAVVDVMLTRGHSRIPVYSEDRDKIVGLIYAKDMLRRMHVNNGNGNGNGNGSWQDLLRPPFFVPELKQVDELLRELQAEKVHLAIVVDEYGATAGLVTIEDILEEIVGEIVDEYDTEETLIEQLPDGGLRVDARLPVDELSDLLSCELPDEQWDTVGGLLFGLLGHVPSPGERVEVSGLTLTAERVAGRRISTVTVARRGTSNGDGPEGGDAPGVPGS